MTDKEYYTKGEELIDRVNSVVYGFATITEICAVLLIPISFFKSEILLYIMGSIILMCILAMIMYKFYFRLRHYKFYKKKSQMDRLNWHYPFSKRQWKIRKVGFRATWLSFIVLGISLLLFFNFPNTDKTIQKVLFMSLSISSFIALTTYLLNYKVYQGIKKERGIRIRKNEEHIRMLEHNARM